MNREAQILGSVFGGEYYKPHPIRGRQMSGSLSHNHLLCFTISLHYHPYNNIPKDHSSI